MRTRFLSLFLVLLTSIAAQAAVDGIVVAGQGYAVRTNNGWKADGKAGTAFSKGSITWDGPNKTLTLDNVYIEVTGGTTGLDITSNNVSDITVKLIGQNSVYTNSTPALQIGDNVTLTGEGNLNVGSWEKPSLNFVKSNVDFKISGPTFIIGRTGNIHGTEDKTCTISVSSGTLRMLAKPKRTNAIENIKYINRGTDIAIKQPHGAYLATNGRLMDVNHNIVNTDAVLIEKAKYYGFKIGGVRVNEANYDLLDKWNFYNKNVKMTGVSFNYSSRTLTLNNATITTVSYSYPVIENDEGLTINCTGTNRFVYEADAKDNLGLKVNHDLTFIGGGTLDMTNGSNYNYGGIYITESPTNFYNYANLKTPRVYSSKSGGVHMYCRDKWDNPRQTGTLTATGHPDGTFKGLMMGTIKAGYEDGSFYSKFDNRLPFKTYAKKPVMYQYGDPDTSIYGVVDVNKKYVTGLVEYEGNQVIYPVEVAGYPVTSSNKDRMSNRYIGGTVSYEPSVTGNPVLNVDAWLEARTDAPAIKYTGSYEELLVKYNDKVRIDCEQGAEAVVSSGPIRFVEASTSAYLEVKGKIDSENLEDRTGLFAVDNTLTFDNLTKIELQSVEASELNVYSSNIKVYHHLGKLNSHPDKWFKHGSYYQKGSIRGSEVSTKTYNTSAVYLPYENGFMSRSRVFIEKATDVEKYNVWVEGVQVTNYNRNNIVTEDYFHNDRDYEGIIYYSKSDKQLNFENAYLFDGRLRYPLVKFTGSDTYTLNFAGKNELQGNTMNGNSRIGIVVDGATLKVNGGGSADDKHTLNVRMLRLENNAKVIFDKPLSTKDNVKTTVEWVESDNSNTSMQVDYPPVFLKGDFYDYDRATIRVKSLKVANNIVAVDENDDLLTIRNDGVYTSNGQPKTHHVTFIDKDKRTIHDTGLQFTKSTYKLTYIGAKEQLEYKVLPENATHKEVLWKSSNENIVYVNKDGWVIAMENGEATITGTTWDGNTAKCTVTVETTPPSVIKMQPETLAIDPTNADQEYTVIAALGDNTFDDHRIDWTIEGNENLIEIVRTYSDYNRMEEWGYVGYLQVAVVKANVSPTGGPTEGTCKLVATTPNGGPRGECVITLHQPVLAQRVVFLDQNGTSVDKVNIAGAGRYQNVTAKVYPETAENVTFQIVGNVTATGVNSVAQMNPKHNGKPNEFTISGIGEGTTRLGVYVKNGDAVLCSTFLDVTVHTPVPVESITTSIVEEDNKIMGIGNTLQLEAEISPVNSDCREVTWSSSDNSIATVDENGVATGKAYGHCYIIATAADGSGKTGSELIYVVDPSDYEIVRATSIALNRTAATTVPNGRIEIEAILTPADANEYIEWHMYDSGGNDVGGCNYVSWLAPRDSRKCTVDAGMTGTYTIVANPKDRESVRATCRLTVRDEKIFYVQNADGISICYRETKIDDPDNMQCEVYGNESEPAVADGLSGKLVIPSQVTYNGNTYNVKHITDEAFKRCSYLTEVVVSEGIETIGARAFMFDEATWAMPGEFFSASLKTVTLPASLKGLGEDCFSGQYSLTTVYMNCEEQPGSVYWGSNTVDDQMIYGAHPFDMINGEATLYVPDGALDTYYGLDIDKPWNRWFSHIEEMGSHDCYMYFTEKCPEGAEIMYFCTNSASKKCVVQGQVDGAIILPAVATNADERNASEITVPEKVRGGEFTVVGIGPNAFRDVEGLYTVRLPKSIQTLGQEAFWNCSYLNDVYFAAKEIPMFVDYDGHYINSDVDYTWMTSIFDAISQTAVLHVPFGCKSYYDYDPWPMWFKGGVVEEDTYFAEETAKGDDVSYRITNEEEMTCEVKADPNVGITAVASNVTEVEIPEMVDEYVVTGIAAEAFQSLTNLRKVTLPATTEYIGQSAFQMCTSLTDVTILADEVPTLLDWNGQPTDDNYAFLSIGTAMARSLDKNAQSDEMAWATLHVPYGCRKAYDKEPWNWWFTSIVDDATPPSCDVNKDGAVDVADIATVISVMAGTEPIFEGAADVNRDGTVDVADIATVISRMAQLARQQRNAIED